MAFEILGKSEQRLNVDSMLQAAIYGDALTGVEAEVAAELQHRHGKGHGGVRVPFAALVQRATGAGPLVGGANAFLDFQMDAGAMIDIGGGILGQLTAAQIGFRMTATSEAVLKVPLTTARPTGVIVDLDEPVPDQGGSIFSTLDISPVIAGSILDVENSIDFARVPSARQLVAQHIAEAVTKTMDDAILNGYLTGSGRTWAGLDATATATGLVLSAASDIQDWRAIPDTIRAYLGSTNLQGYKWVWSPTVTGLLQVSPIFAGATAAIAPTEGISTLTGYPATEVILPITAVPDTTAFFLDPSVLHVAMFNSGSVELVSNPFAEPVFARGATRLRILTAFGVGCSDPARIRKFTVAL